ncbi:MAG: hypothetical protein CL431_02445 [Acidimicrobiaceae bacterium]|nr:hypothetical protein [Acidimicrobiaceae bacterium]
MMYFFLVERTDFCNRVGCAREADCVLLMVPQSRKAWIVDIGHEKAVDGSALCEIHASRITVPQGWKLLDERSIGRKKIQQSQKANKHIAPQTKAEIEITNDTYQEPGDAYQETGMNVEISIEDVHVQVEQALSEDMKVDESLEELVSEPFEDSFLHVVPDDYSDEEVTQGTFWDEDQDMQPSEENPLLQRAFRIVNDE